MANKLHDISIRDVESLKENEYYLEYWKQKQEIKSKYPSDLFDNIERPGAVPKKIRIQELNDYSKNHRVTHKKYLKEVCDLLFEPDGYFQQFSWDNMGETEKLFMERKARGRKTTYDTK